MKLLALLSLIVSLLLSSVVLPQAVHAASDSIVILQLQTGGSGRGTATEELLLLYNTSENTIEITDWCVEYSSAADNVGFRECIEPDLLDISLWIEPKGVISFATDSFVMSNVGFNPDFIISGGMAGSGGHVRLFDDADIEVDKIGWGTAINPEEEVISPHNSGEVLSRDLSEIIDTDNNSEDFSSQSIIEQLSSGLFEVEEVIDVCANILDVQESPPDTFLVDEEGNCFQDVCDNLEGLQKTLPDNYELVDSFICEEIPLESSILFITELRPNAPSVDDGQEFIELFNPNNRTILLNGYKLQLGPSFTKEYVFVGGEIISEQYLIISDTDSGIVLPNASGQPVRLIAPNGETVSQTAVYENADDDVSWALVEDQWIFTNQITPGGANLPFLEEPVDEVLGVTTVLGPCPSGKFRNPETNRCKNIESSVSQLVPCDEDEFRNPETNRCNKISSSSALGPCPEGQERNAETNRCRNVVVLASSDGGLTVVQDVSVESAPGTINWPIILLAVGGTLAYMAYEWRNELSQKTREIKLAFKTRFQN